MIISRKHRYIFLHTPKTGGSSVACFLSKSLGSRDLMADAWKDAIAHGASINRQFVLDLISPAGVHALASERIRSLRPSKKSEFGTLLKAHQAVWKKRLFGEYAHACAEDLQKCYPSEFKSYFKFTFVRNPYAHAVSLWRWRTRNSGNQRTDFGQFLKILVDSSESDPGGLRRKNKWEPTGWPVFAIDGNVAVDFVGRLENLEKDMAVICERLSLPFEKLPHAKKLSNDPLSYRNLYGPNEKQIVQKLYRPFFENFDYEF